MNINFLLLSALKVHSIMKSINMFCYVQFIFFKFFSSIMVKLFIALVRLGFFGNKLQTFI